MALDKGTLGPRLLAHRGDLTRPLKGTRGGATPWRLRLSPGAFVSILLGWHSPRGCKLGAPPPPQHAVLCAAHTPGRTEPSEEPPPWKSAVGHWCRSSTLPVSCVETGETRP